MSSFAAHLNAACTALLIAAASVQAQQVQPPASAPRDTGTVRREAPALSPSQRDVLRRLQQSGLTREQVRQRLRDAGYDPQLADRYFDEMSRPDSTEAPSRLSRIAEPLPQPTGSLAEALRRIGVLQVGDTLASDSPPADTLRQRARVERSTEPQVFGRELFAATTQFDATVTGPVDPDYRIGPGDQLTVIVTGEVEVGYDLQVTREGYIVIPEVGQVVVNGLTLDQMRARLNERMGRVYSGVQAGTAQVDVTVGRLRSKLVYVIGEVEVPGAYQLPGSATVFSALYRAGGPALNGSFRMIEVRRNNRVIQRVDLYSYLLNGDRGADVRLEQGDVVFVPIVGIQATITGAVRRPAIFEMNGTEGLRELLRFAGGAEAQAAVERIQIDRILPPGQRQAGRERVLIDVPLEELVRGRDIALIDGDRVRISAISDARRNRVAVSGDIQRPGEYEYRAGMTVQDLISAAQGLLPTAYTPTAHVVRTNPVDSSTALIRVVLDDPASPDHPSRIRLMDLDELVIFGNAKLANPKFIEIFGYVKNPGTYSYSEGMSIQDLVLLAGGFEEGAADGQAEVARRNRANGVTDSLATVYRVPLQSAQPFLLDDGDQVFIRRAVGFQPLSTVTVVGEVIYPGPYTVESRQERVSQIIRRAGGLTPEAYAKGFRLFRDGKPVAVDFERALARPGSADDLLVEPGDRIEMPRLDPTVLVTGAVQFESRIRWDDDLSVNDYIERAGGVRDDGNKDKVTVRYANGAIRTPRSLVGIKTYPRVEPGSTITVPLKSETSAFDWDRVVGRTLAALSTLATIMLTINAIK